MAIESRRYLSILDVGHGNCAVVHIGDAGVIVIDAGPGTGLLEFLDEQRIESIRTVYISHADVDHIAALLGLLESDSVAVERVIVNSDSTKQSKVWDDLLYELELRHRRDALEFTVGLVSGNCERLDDVTIEVLGPSRYLAGRGAGSTDRSGRRITTNSISAVIGVVVGGQRTAVISGDLDEVGLDDLLEHASDVRAPVVVYPHHGLRPGNADVRGFAERLLGATEPHVVVFSFSRRRYRAPYPETVRVVREVRPDARVVCTQLSEHCSRTTSGSSFSHLNDSFAEGRADGTCCAGTIVVPLDGSAPGAIQPSHLLHRDFIVSCVETPLCLMRIRGDSTTSTSY